MRLALIGIDDLFPALVRAIVGSRDHRLVAVCDADETTAALQSLCPDTNWGGSWESLLAEREVDAVIFARSRDPNRSEEQLKRLAQEGVSLLVMHPACDVMQAYEIEMIRRDVGGIVLPYAPAWWHPAWSRLFELVTRDQNASADIEQIIWERSFTSDRSSSVVLRQFNQDEPILRRLMGQIVNVSAVGASADNSSLGNLSIHCASAAAATARWSVAPAGSEPVSRVTLVRQDSTILLHMPCNGGGWSLRQQGQQELAESFPPWDDAQQLLLLSELQLALQGQAMTPSWSDVCQSLETADAVQKSLRRKRAIELNAGERSEEYTFKGYMAAMGCLVLILVLAGFFVLAVVEGFRMPLRDSAVAHQGEPVVRWPLWARLWPVYPLIAFLMLQFLLRLARLPASERST